LQGPHQVAQKSRILIIVCLIIIGSRLI